MRTKHYFLLSTLAIGGALFVERPARIRDAQVTDVSGTTPPIAHIALTYGPGKAPISLIIDIYCADGSGGSATITNQQRFVEVPIHGTLKGEYCITTTATYRILGRAYTIRHVFSATASTSDTLSHPASIPAHTTT